MGCCEGGVNLRAWFGSLRYSEDLDIDVLSGEPHALEERVDGVFASRDLDLPPRFSRREAQRWIKRIQAPYLRTMVRRRLEEVLAEARPRSAMPRTHGS